MNWDIRPLDGIGPLLLGMSPAQVAAALDATAPVTARQDEGGGFVREVRGGETPICQFKDGALFLVDTHPFVPGVTFDGLLVFEAEPRAVLQRLEALNGGARTYWGFTVFEAVGINTEGFWDVRSRAFFTPGASDDRRGLAVYRPGPDTALEGTLPGSFG